jgi:hypothetical protein
MVKMPFEKKQPEKSVDVSKLIDKGAALKEDMCEGDKNDFFIINLRMRKTMIKEIDEAVKEEADKQGICLSRTAWLLQLIQKEMKRLRNEKK